MLPQNNHKIDNDGVDPIIGAGWNRACVLEANIAKQGRGYLRSRDQRQPLKMCTGSAEFGPNNQELRNRGICVQ